eukprot:Gb_18526 [translate_table: standard]
MADAYWRLGADRDGRPMGIPTPTKRARNDLAGIPGGRDIPGYLPDMAGRSFLRESNQSALDSHVRNGNPSYSAGGIGSAEIGGLGGGLGMRLGGSFGGLSGSSLGDPGLMGQRSGIASMDPGFAGKTGSLGLSYQRSDAQLREPLRRPEEHLPADASNTLFVEGLPTDCTRREAAHIFRPFIGFKEVRLVQKEPKRPGGDPLVLCFVDFADARCAATALEALQEGFFNRLCPFFVPILIYHVQVKRITYNVYQRNYFLLVDRYSCMWRREPADKSLLGYKFDESDRESSALRLQFARFPGPRGSSGSARDELHRGGRDRDDSRPRSRR